MFFQPFDWDLTHQLLFNFILCSHHSYELDRLAFKMRILWCRTDICTYKLSAKVSLMLDNPFPVHRFLHQNHLQSAYFLQGKPCLFLKWSPVFQFKDFSIFLQITFKVVWTKWKTVRRDFKLFFRVLHPY